MTALIYSAMKDDPYFKLTEVDEMDVEKEKEIPKTYVKELPHLTIQPALLSSLYTPSSTEFKELPVLDETSKLAGSKYGTKMHEIMEALPNKLWTMQDLEAYALSTTDKQRILSFSQSDIYQQCLSMEIHKEFPFYVEQNGERITGTMDFLAMNDSNIILIDYKTDNASIPEIKQRYSPQLKTYMKALSIMYPGKEVKAYAYSFHHESFIQI